MRVIGLDPGLRRTGWGVIDAQSGRLKHIESGVCASDDKAALSDRLAQIYRRLSEVFAAYKPDCAAVEQTFVNRDPAGALKLGQARGVVLLAPAMFGAPVSEYAPTTVKKSVVGGGRADKTQVAHMVKLLLPGAKPENADAADALAIAICHAHHAPSAALRRA
ncbi:MAG: crossover junction endodeoxyribonuclease RuvC [Neomegalonema sp.]|nr:crossover junction endodeoxyribonuclease RuvC [Neomegalonema sp.]